MDEITESNEDQTILPMELALVCWQRARKKQRGVKDYFSQFENGSFMH
jgi:hypothetical protein